MIIIKTTIFSGKLNILGINFAFDFDGQTIMIHLYDNEGLIKSLIMEDLGNGCYVTHSTKTLPFKIIEGVVLPNNRKVIFKIDNRSFHYDNPLLLNNGHLYIAVYRYMFIDNYHSKITGSRMYYKSNYMQKFLGFNINYLKDNDNKRFIIKDNYETIKNYIGHYSNKKIYFKIMPDYSYKTGSVFEIKPQLLIKSNRKLPSNKLFDIYEKINKIIQVIFLRNNIYPEEFVIINGMVKYTIHERDWDIYKEKDENMNFSNNIESPLWCDLYKNIDKVADNILGDSSKVYSAFIYNRRIERYEYSIASISSDSAMFEHIFSLVYPNFDIHKQKDIQKYKCVHKLLKKQITKNTGKIKEIYKGLDDYVDHVRLEDKIKYALKDYSKRIEYIKKELKKCGSINKIAKTCADYRNQVDHGRITFIINDEIANEFSIYRALILAMIYEKWGLDYNTISSTLNNVFLCK